MKTKEKKTFTYPVISIIEICDEDILTTSVFSLFFDGGENEDDWDSFWTSQNK